MTHYQLLSARDTLHGNLPRTTPPVLTINPEDTMDSITLKAGQWISPPDPPSSLSGTFMEHSVSLNRGHAPCSPIRIRGIHPGMTFSVRASQILTDIWEWSHARGGDPGHLGHTHFRSGECFLTWEIDRKKGTCTSHLGHNVPLPSFMDVMAIAPNTDDYVKTHIPGPYGTNMDCKDIIAGSILYLSVYAEDALFPIGGSHARQDDGESGCTAIECPMECISPTSNLIDESLASPVCNSPKGWITFGSHSDSIEAAYYALMEMRRLMERLYGFSSKEVLTTASVAVNICITQLVNDMRGVHALLSHDIITL